jgi:hypothetical protein
VRAQQGLTARNKNNYFTAAATTLCIATASTQSARTHSSSQSGRAFLILAVFPAKCLVQHRVRENRQAPSASSLAELSLTENLTDPFQLISKTTLQQHLPHSPWSTAPKQLTRWRTHSPTKTMGGLERNGLPTSIPSTSPRAPSGGPASSAPLVGRPYWSDYNHIGCGTGTNLVNLQAPRPTAPRRSTCSAELVSTLSG